MSGGPFENYVRRILKAGGFRSMFCATCGCTVFVDQEMPTMCFLCGGSTFSTDRPHTPALTDFDRLFLSSVNVRAW